MRAPHLLLILIVLGALSTGAYLLLSRTHAPEGVRGVEAPRTSGSIPDPIGATGASPTDSVDGARPERSAAIGSSATRSVRIELTVPEGTPPDADLRVIAVEADSSNAANLLRDLREGENRSLAEAVFSADGTASLALPADAADAKLLLDGRFLFLGEATVVTTDTSSVRLEPRLGAHLVVQVSLPGSDEPSGKLSLTGGNFSGRSRGGWVRREQAVEPGATLEFKALDPELTWTLMPALEDHHADVRMGLEFEPGEEAALELAFQRAARITGRVVDRASSGLAGVEVRTANGSPWLMGADVRKTVTEANGEFELRGVAPGTVTIEARSDGWLTAKSDEMELAAGETRKGVEVILGRGASIAGTVVFEDGTPAGSAVVTVEGLRRRGFGAWGGSQLQKLGESSSLADGTFRITGLEEGSYTVKAELESTSDSTETVWRAQADAVSTGTSDLSLELEGPVAFAGRVVDDRGEPVTSFRIEARSVEEGGPRADQSFDDEDGRFRFERVGPGEWNITAKSDGHVQEDPRELVLPGAGEIELRLLRTASISGRVLDAAGTPVAGASVRADDGGQSNPWMGSRGPRTETDESGRFELVELEPRSLTLVASLDGWADSEPLAFELAPGDVVEEAALALRVGGRIEGIVSTPDGEPESGKRVTWGSNSMGFGSRGETRTDGQGHFMFDHVTPGDWSVTAAPSFAEMGERMNGKSGEAAFAEVMGELLTETVTVVDGEITEVFLGGEPLYPVRIVGRVTEAGEPLSGASVYAVSEGSAVFQGMKTSQTNADGAFELVVDRPGSYVVSTRVERVGVEAYVDVPRAEQTRVDLAIPQGRIEGKIERPDGRPAAGVRLAIQREDHLGRMRWGGDNATSDEEGRYSFVSLEEGTYTVRANTATWGGRSDDSLGTNVRGGITVESDRTTAGVDFKLEKAGTVEGIVRGPDGDPTADVSLFFRDAAGRMVAQVSNTSTDGSGRFEQAGLAPGEYSVSARADGFASSGAVTVRVASGETAEVALVVETGVRVRVRLEDESGEAQRAKIEVLDRDDREVGGLITMRELQAMFNQGFSSVERTLGPLAPGRYRVRATLPDGEVVEKKVWLRSRDDEKKVVLKLKN